MKKVLSILAIALLILTLGVAGFVAWTLYPHEDPQTLPSGLIAVDSVVGMQRLQKADSIADYPGLSKSYQSQAIASYCGVASSVAVLQALGRNASQWDFFTDETDKVRSRWQVTFGGMTLSDLTGLLASHGLKTSVHYADQFSVKEFRAAIEHNLANSQDYLLVNYQREELGQGRAGHISPLAAYDRESDSVLIMDTAGYKYPPTWVPVELLYAGMKTTDSDGGRMRGYLEVSN